MRFSQKMPLNFFYTMVQKVKNDQKLKTRVPALNLVAWVVFYRQFWVSKVITTAHARKSGVTYHHFSQAFA